MGRWGEFAAAAIAAVAAAVGIGQQAAAQTQPAGLAIPCGGDEFGRGTVSRITDGRDFLLTDGREVRLAGIEVPLLPEPGETVATAPEGSSAKDALAAIIGHAEVVLKRAEIEADRYGRAVAYVETVADGSQNSVQAQLVSAGFARVGGSINSPRCATALLQQESIARQAKLGLWARPYYDVLRADEPGAVLAQRGHFVLVEGKVVSVHKTSATTYMNFSRDWSDEFAVTVRKRNESRFKAVGVSLQALAGRRVRVRGWVEQRRGPWIEAAYPEQIELADQK